MRKTLFLFLIFFAVYFSYINRSVLLALIEVMQIQTASLYTDSNEISDDMEAAPFDLGGLHYLVSVRGEKLPDQNGFAIFDEKHVRISFYPTPASLASVLVFSGRLFVAASSDTPKGSGSEISIYEFDRGLTLPPSRRKVMSSASTRFFNSSLAYDETQKLFVLAYEIDEKGLTPFSIRFAVSKDLKKWDQVNYTFSPDEYAACPTIRVIKGIYYMWFLEKLKRSTVFLTRVARSADMVHWDVSKIAFLSPTVGENINTSDFDYVNFKGHSHVFYAIGDQTTYSKIKHAVTKMEIDSIADLFFSPDPRRSLAKIGVAVHRLWNLIPFVVREVLRRGVKFLPAPESFDRYWKSLLLRCRLYGRGML